MANQGHSTVTRRAALAGTAAGTVAIAAGALPAVADEHPDAEILELGRQFDALTAVLAEADQRWKAADERCEAATPDIPDALKVRPEDAELRMPTVYQRFGFSHYCLGDVDKLRSAPRTREVRTPIKAKNGSPIGGEPQFFAPGEDIGEFPRDHVILARGEPWPEAQARADEIVAAHDAHHTAENEIAEASGRTACDAEIDAILERVALVREAILDKRAVTFAGMAVKIRVGMWYIDADFDGFLKEHRDTAGQDGDAIASLILDIAQQAPLSA